MDPSASRERLLPAAPMVPPGPDHRRRCHRTGRLRSQLGWGVKSDRAELERTRAFLLANQNEDGFLADDSPTAPGEKPATNPAPITYLGSAWATLGLMWTVPNSSPM